jgi:hypothetical protein
MKTLIKITALALLAALAAFSCAPEAELTGVDWSEVKAGNNPEKNSSITPPTFAPSGTLSTAASAVNEVTITFPASSDFLKAGSNVEARLREFLSFHHFTRASEPVDGKADTLGEALAYTYVKRLGNVITVKLTKTFVAADSNVVMKIDGTKYTFANGNKLDRAGRGRGGEALYDDVYSEITVTGRTTGASDFTAPGNKGWTLALGTISAPPSSLSQETLTNYTIATLTANGANSDIAEAVANQLKSGLKIQKFSNGAWADVNASIEYFTTLGGLFTLRVTSLGLDDLTPYRVAWEGSAPVTTTAEYFGVKQYVRILGANTSSVSNSVVYRTGRVYGNPGLWYNTYNDQRFYAPAPQVLNISKDFYHRNVAFDVVFYSVTYGTPTATTYWLKDLTSDKQTFKDNFKIVYCSSGGAFTAGSTDAVYIDIKDFEFFSYNPDGAANVGLNAIRITLDPAYEDTNSLYFYISPEIRYADDKTTFGDPANFMNGCFKAYAAYDGTRP